MKNIKGIPRKTKYEVLSVEVLGINLRGMSKYIQANLVANRRAGDTVYTKQEILLRAASNIDIDNIDGLKPHLITVRVPVRQWARKNRSHKPNDWRDRTIATLAVDEIEAYQIAKKKIQWWWQKAFKLDRYRRR